jgi:hypothetical protein
MDGNSVYLGVWTNWSNGTVMDATLTTTRQRGNLLISFTGFLIPFVASRFWSIFSFVFHQCYSTSEPRDAIHHQHQVILRNSSSPDTGLSRFSVCSGHGATHSTRPRQGNMLPGSFQSYYLPSVAYLHLLRLADSRRKSPRPPDMKS